MESSEYALMDAAEDSLWWYRALHLRLLNALDGVDGPILDAGCGTGGFLARLRVARPELAAVGVDFSPEAGRRAAEKSQAPVACASLEALPFADASFAAVVSADVLCHRSLDPARALAEMARVLRPGGRLVLNLPAYDWLMSAHDRRVQTARRTTAGALRRDLAAAGFGQVRTGYWNGLLLPLVVLRRKVLARGRDAASDVRPAPPLLDAMLFAITEAERRLPFRPPAGSSVMAVARAP